MRLRWRIVPRQTAVRTLKVTPKLTETVDEPCSGVSVKHIVLPLTRKQELSTFSHRQGNDNANRKSPHDRALKQQRSGEAAFKPLRQGLHHIHDVEQSPAMTRHFHPKRQNCLSTYYNTITLGKRLSVLLIRTRYVTFDAELKKEQNNLSYWANSHSRIFFILIEHKILLRA